MVREEVIQDFLSSSLSTAGRTNARTNFSEPEFMEAVLKKAFGLKVSVDELKKFSRTDSSKISM